MDYLSLDKASSEQLYLQIRRMVLNAIRVNELRPRQQIPSVNELSAKLGVSRMTVRQALQTLIYEGWLYTVAGKGTFIAERPHIDLQSLKGWTEEIRSQGKTPSTRIITIDLILTDRTTSTYLNIAPGEWLWRIVRVRYANDFPLSIEKSYLIKNRFPEIVQYLQQPFSSLYNIFRQAYGVNPIRATQFLEAGEADQGAAELLQLKPGSPVLISERITYTADNEPLEYVYAITRPGFVRFKTEMNVDSSNVWQIQMPDDGPGEDTRLRS
jgi:GntR family transcriptional regulator